MQNTLENQKLVYEDKSAQLEDRYEKLKAHFFGMQEQMNDILSKDRN